MSYWDGYRRGVDREYIEKQETKRTRIRAESDVQIQRLQNEAEIGREKYKAQMEQDRLRHELDMTRTEHEHEQFQLREEAEERKHNEKIRLEMHKEQEATKRYERDIEVQLKNIDLEDKRTQLDHDLKMEKLEANKEASKMVGQILGALMDKNMSATEFAYMALVSNSTLRQEPVDLKALEVVGTHASMFQNPNPSIKSGQKMRALRAKQDINYQDDEDDYNSSEISHE